MERTLKGTHPYPTFYDIYAHLLWSLKRYLMQHLLETPGRRDPANTLLSPGQECPWENLQESQLTWAHSSQSFTAQWHCHLFTLSMHLPLHQSWFAYLANRDDDAYLWEVPLPQSELIRFDSLSKAFVSKVKRPHKLVLRILNLPLHIPSPSFSVLCVLENWLLSVDCIN